MPSPVIGITPSRNSSSYGSPQITMPEAYAQALADAGAAPVLIPLGLSKSALQQIFARLDGILLSGGGDVHPELYGAELQPLVSGIDLDRDRVEIELVRAAIAAKKPILGICRGIQVINVALGGDLYADISQEMPQALKHDCFPEKGRDFLAHLVSLKPDSRLAAILGKSPVHVNSMHHQGIRHLAPGLTATAHAPDGLIEAFELSEHPFALAVQWHPECLLDHEPMRSLFLAFTKAALGNAQPKESVSKEHAFSKAAS